MSPVKVPTYVYQDAEGNERAIESKSGVPLTDAEIVSKGRDHFGDAKFVRKVMPEGHPQTPVQKAVGALSPEYKQAQSQVQDLPFGSVASPQPEGTLPDTRLSPQEKLNLLGTIASMTPGMAGPRLAIKALPTLPRLARFLGMTGGGAVGGATGATVAGRPEDIPLEATVGAGMGAGGASALLGKGAAMRHGPGATNRMGRVMAEDIGRVAGTQSPAMSGLKTQQNLLDWRLYGQERMNKLYEGPKQAIMAALPPEVATIAGQKAAVPTFNPAGGGPVYPGLNIPAIAPKPLSFEEALREIQTLGTSFAPGKAGAAPGVQESRQAWMAAQDQLRDELKRHGVPPKVLSGFDEARRQYAAAVGWKDVLPPQAFDQSTLLPIRVQEALKSETAEGGLLKSMGFAKGHTDFNKMADTILRGKMRTDPSPDLGGAIGPAVGETDIGGMNPLALLRMYFLPTASEVKMRAGMAAPHGRLWTSHVAGPGRLPYEVKGQAPYDTTAILAQWLRAKLSGEPPAVEK